jgi:hypothetical protein
MALQLPQIFVAASVQRGQVVFGLLFSLGLESMVVVNCMVEVLERIVRFVRIFREVERRS